MKSPWKFISNLTSRRRSEEPSQVDEQLSADATQSLPSTPTADDTVEHTNSADPIDTVEAVPAEETAVEDATTKQSDDSGPTEPHAEPQPQTSASSDTSASNDGIITVDGAGEPVDDLPTEIDEIEVVEPSVSTPAEEADDSDPTEPPLASDPVQTVIPAAAKVRAPRQMAKRKPVLPVADQRGTEMQTIEDDIKQLRRTLAEKLKEQNAQLRALIDRY